MAVDLKATHATALERFAFIAETETPQRKSELEALRFEAGDMWPEDAKVSRAGIPANTALGTPAVPARPMLTMRTLDQPLAQLSSQESEADLGITITPKDTKASVETAAVLQGLIRAIEYDSRAEEAYAWGFQRMRACGRGYWRVDKALAKGSEHGDQVLRVKKILNGASVYLDPLGEFQDQGGEYEDPAGEFGFVTQDVPETTYKRLWGQSKLATASDSEILEALGDDAKHWVIQSDKAGKTYRVAEYWFATYPNKQRTINWGKMNGVEFLDAPQEWDGHYIPIVCDSANEFNIGGERKWEGLVQPSMSPCQMINYMVSGAAEKFGTSTMAPWIGVAGQFQGFEAWWDQANVRNFSKLEYNAKTEATGNELLPPPTRNNDSPAIQAHAEMIGLFINFVRSTTGQPDAALGHVNPNDRSGKAIEELKRAAERGSSGYLKRHARAIQHTGVITLDLAPPIYDRPGRMEQIIGDDGDRQPVMLNAPFTRDQQGQPVQQGTMGRMGAAIGSAIGMPTKAVERHMLEEGQYNVIVNVGKSEQTRRQETQVGLGALAQAAPELVPRFADLWVASMDIPEAEAIAARIKPPGVDGPQDPAAMQAQIQQLTAQLQEASQLADNNKTKILISAHDNANDQWKAKLEAETKVLVAEIASKNQAAIADMKAQLDVFAKLAGIAKEERLAHAQHAHDADQTAHDAAHGLAMAVVDHLHTTQQQASQQDHATELANTPPPVDPNAQQPEDDGA